MGKLTSIVLALVWILAACAPAAPSPQPTPSLPLSASSTPIQFPSPAPKPLASPNPAQATSPTTSPTPAPPGENALLPSPDGQWTAILDREAGSLEVEDEQGVKHTVFPAGSTVHDASWSPDSRRLTVALSNTPRSVQSSDEIGIAEIWMVMVTDKELSEPRRIRVPEHSDEDAGPWITFGAWSPDGARLLFWVGPPSASIEADGLPLWSLEVETGEATRLAETALLNPAYQSWSSDGSALVFTSGGYRSAQVNKWLSLYEVGPGQVRSLIAMSEFVPGAVAWSPAGDTIAFAAVRASQTGDEWADWMSWENPAILARRIYLLDPQAGEYRRLNSAEAYQDAPRWSTDGAKLYYVQMDSDQATIMSADPETGEAQPLPGCLAPLPSGAGYYGLVDWAALYENCPEATQSYTRNQSEKSGATLTGQVIAGYGDHQPVSGLPLRIRQKDDENWNTYTDANGYFTLTGLPVGRVDIDDDHLSFWVTIDSSSQVIDLGKVKYPLIHPPLYYYWQAAPLADPEQLLRDGKVVAFEVCAADSNWVRPDPGTQREQVYAQPPFSQLDEKGFEKFEQIAVLYDTIDVTFANLFAQGLPAGLNLDELGAGWLYLTGLWTAAKNPLSNSGCSYLPGDLRSLLDRSQLEVWLFGYQATKVQELDKEQAEFSQGSLCDSKERSCTVRPGYHYAVRVEPTPGFQIIRFAGEQDVLTIHIVESDKEILALP